MKELIKINGMKEIENMKFHDIEGAFGEGKKAMLVKEIAEIHGRDIKDINRNINNNIERFKNGTDILDLKTGEYKPLVLNMGFTNAQYGNANNIYLLSERGYAKLLKILEDDIAWEQYEKLVDGYFNMRRQFNNISKELQAIFMLDEKAQELGDRIGKIENNMTIDYAQQEELNTLAKKVVVKTLGGVDAPAYKELNKKAFSQFWKDYKTILQVNSYKNTAVKDFVFARKVMVDWKPSRELELMIKGANSQIRM